jgi:1,4-dihydroxy-6-naphthoate synthase
MKTLKLGFSPCPNDTFIFHAMTHSLVDTEGLSFETHITDVEELNRSALEGFADVTKLSFHAWLKLKEKYELLRSGAALGFGCGPLLVSKTGTVNHNSCIAVPGELTTAALLLKIYIPGVSNLVYTRFDNIMPGVASGEFDAGVIIHEGRFVYSGYGLSQVVDLGEWWEKKTGMPIPLGCIAIKKSLGEELKISVEKIIRESVQYAFLHPDDSHNFIRQHAAEMNDDVIRQHIKLYVNNYSVDLGNEGLEAVRVLETLASEKGII